MNEPVMEIAEYVIVNGEDKMAVASKIEAYIALGWELYGNLQYQVTADHHQWFAQALVKKQLADTRGAWG